MDYCPPPSAAYIEYLKKHNNYSSIEKIQFLLIKNNIIFIPEQVMSFTKQHNLKIIGLDDWFNGVDFIRHFNGQYIVYKAFKPITKEYYYILANGNEVRLATPREIKKMSNCPWF